MDDKWKEILEKDRDWDFAFLLIILKHKLERMSAAFKSGAAITVKAHDRAAEMDIVIAALSRLLADTYYSDWDNWADAEAEQSRDLDLAFDTMKENILGWWD